ncbi:ABC transporter ATP-binding protein [Natronoglycomyces albus]|uniref:ABC transporter ATP-binding protein n=1 Tax=Natronoglycomyces albus TaxID=2811108 RepID=A0A895XU68_9ACTN|nr:ABC transporter ATP-binding protein [Natronoglycomyces albus]QSB05198.1 ABC transporter ATP-binding protein [Natronoglycomyces albus]
MSDATELAIRVTDLTRTYQSQDGAPERTALDQISMAVPHGEVHGLLGPNGAGKTTLCKILSTLLVPTSGSATVSGFDVTHEYKRIQPLVGIVFGGEKGLYNMMTAADNLHFWAGLYNVKRSVAKERVPRLLDLVGLRGRAHDRVDTLSRGMRQRLHLARGLIGDPRILILDEPTVGMDPIAAQEFRNLIRDLREDNITFLLTTHNMAEAESLCDRVSFIDSGKLLHCESPHALRRSMSSRHRIVAKSVPGDIAAQLEQRVDVEQVRLTDSSEAHIDLTDKRAAQEVLFFLTDIGIDEVSLAPATLEEVYIQLIGERGMELGS